MQLIDFTNRVFEPAFKRVRDRFGASPLIVKMPWQEGFELFPDPIDVPSEILPDIEW